jgi:hypothetical protein
MISGVGDWMFIIMMIFHNGSGMVAAKRYETEQACNAMAVEAIEAAQKDDVQRLMYRCTQLHGRDPRLVAGQIGEEFTNSIRDDYEREDSVPGY